MAHLLGGQECVESLRRDVIDLQGALVEVFSRTGPVRFPSWKFPGKVGGNVDLVAVLQQYDYVEGELEFNQHSHVVLLELVIDRLLLLLQSFNTYTEQMIGGHRPGHSAQAGAPVCIGPVVKRYWSSLVQFSSQQRQTRIQSAGRSQGPSSSPPSGLHLSPVDSGAPQTRTLGSQTVESSLVPCDACAHVQAALKQSANGLASLSKCLGLPCSLWGLLEAVDETLQLGRLSACDVALWACEQKKDLGRIQDHVTQVKENVDSLRERMHQVEEERESARAELQRENERRKREEKERESLREEVEREQERRRRREEEEQRKKEEEWRNKLQEMKIRAEQEIRRRREEQKRAAEALELKISELQEELKLQRETQQSLERGRESLLQDVHRLRLQEVRWTEMEEKKKEEETELRNTKTLLEKENAKYQSVQRQHQAMQVKQRALLDRVDALVQQCEELQVRLDECEEENAELTHTLTHTVQERDALRERLAQQESECVSLTEDRQMKCVRIGELEECVSRLREELNRAAERERILVAFPELSPQNTAPQSTGDLLTDMEQQLKANTVRILVLEQENASLTNSLTRLKHTRSHTHTHTPAAVRPDSGTSAQDTSERVKEAQTVSSTSVLHQQTLWLSVSPDVEQTYSRVRRAAQTRSAGTNRRRK